MIALFYIVDINSKESYLLPFHIIWHCLQHYIKLVFTVFEMLLGSKTQNENTGLYLSYQILHNLSSKVNM